MQNYLGEIRIFAGTFAPYGWYLCNGQTLSISQNQALFTLLGTIYGGDGVSTFLLPDLRGNIPVSQGQGPGLSNYVLGARAGTESVTLTGANTAHTHSFIANTGAGTTPTPAPGLIAASLGTDGLAYLPAGAGVTPKALSSSALQNNGGSLPHNNMMPTMGVNFIIAFEGIFPSQN